jgi:hypothetical protein
MSWLILKNQMPPLPAPVQQPTGLQDQQQVTPLDINPVNQQANNVPIVQAQVVQGADVGMALKVQQTKLPEFWGQKDSILANKFVKQVDKMISTNNWSNKVDFGNFGLALRGSANTWLDSQITLKKIVGDRERWTII